MQQKLGTRQRRSQVQLFSTRTGQASQLQQPLITKGFTEGHTSKKKKIRKLKNPKKKIFKNKNTKQQQERAADGERTQGTAAELAETILT